MYSFFESLTLFLFAEITVAANLPPDLIGRQIENWENSRHWLAQVRPLNSTGNKTTSTGNGSLYTAASTVVLPSSSFSVPTSSNATASASSARHSTAAIIVTAPITRTSPTNSTFVWASTGLVLLPTSSSVANKSQPASSSSKVPDPRPNIVNVTVDVDININITRNPFPLLNGTTLLINGTNMSCTSPFFEINNENVEESRYQEFYTNWSMSAWRRDEYREMGETDLFAYEMIGHPGWDCGTLYTGCANPVSCEDIVSYPGLANDPVKARQVYFSMTAIVMLNRYSHLVWMTTDIVQDDLNGLMASASETWFWQLDVAKLKSCEHKKFLIQAVIMIVISSVFSMMGPIVRAALGPAAGAAEGGAMALAAAAGEAAENAPAAAALEEGVLPALEGGAAGGRPGFRPNVGTVPEAAGAAAPAAAAENIPAAPAENVPAASAGNAPAAPAENAPAAPAENAPAAPAENAPAAPAENAPPRPATGQVGSSESGPQQPSGQQGASANAQTAGSLSVKKTWVEEKVEGAFGQKGTQVFKYVRSIRGTLRNSKMVLDNLMFQTGYFIGLGIDDNNCKNVAPGDYRFDHMAGLLNIIHDTLKVWREEISTDMANANKGQGFGPNGGFDGLDLDGMRASEGPTLMADLIAGANILPVNEKMFEQYLDRPHLLENVLESRLLRRLASLTYRQNNCYIKCQQAEPGDCDGNDEHYAQSQSCPTPDELCQIQCWQSSRKGGKEVELWGLDKLEKPPWNFKLAEIIDHSWNNYARNRNLGETDLAGELSSGSFQTDLDYSVPVCASAHKNIRAFRQNGHRHYFPCTCGGPLSDETEAFYNRTYANMIHDRHEVRTDCLHQLRDEYDLSPLELFLGLCGADIPRRHHHDDHDQPDERCAHVRPAAQDLLNKGKSMPELNIWFCAQSADGRSLQHGHGVHWHMSDFDAAGLFRERCEDFLTGLGLTRDGLPVDDAGGRTGPDRLAGKYEPSLDRHDD
ncbi:MAG: hypothetical protein M1819_000780 [Sarea resinae]|nr:MAG: hypothetical protein M1819_000780 [Sarea resinae]